MLSVLAKKVFIKSWAARRTSYLDAITSGKKILEDSQKQLSDAQKLLASLPAEIVELPSTGDRRLRIEVSRLEAISKTPFGLREGLSRPCFVAEILTEHPTMLGFRASPDREIPLARFQKHF